MRLKLKGNICIYNYPATVWQWAKKKNTADYHMNNEDEVDESQKSQWKYKSEFI